MDKFIRKINTSPLIRKRITAGDHNLQHCSKTFGISLKKILEREDFSKIPNIVLSICDFLILYGLETEGLFRVNGNTKAVESIKLMFEENYAPTMSNCTDVHAVASVLKSFLRELPDGLVTEKVTLQLYELCNQNVNQVEEYTDEIRIILRQLPDENYNLLKYICNFLLQVVEKENCNKMDCKNLGIVFGPNIFRMNQGSESFKMQNTLNVICTFLISNCKQIFKSNLCQRDLNSGQGYIMDSPLIAQTPSTDGHKSSPSLSGDFDLSSSNDNHIYPAPLPSVSSDLQKVITTCVNSHLSVVPAGSEELEHSGLRRESDVAIMNEMLPEWQAQSNMIDLDDLDGDQEMHESKENSFNRVGVSKNDGEIDALRLVNLERPVSGAAPNFSTSSQAHKRSSSLSNNTAEKQQHSIQELTERANFLRKKLKEYEDHFELQHGCKPQIERSGNIQVQEWLAELMRLKEKINNLNSGQGLYQTSDESHKQISTNKNTMSATSSYSLVSDQNKPAAVATNSPTATRSTASGTKVEMRTIEQIEDKSLSVVQFLNYVTNALDSQRKKCGRPELLSEMTREQCEEEKVDLQKCLLHFEKLYGRPQDFNVKQIMKPLYDRYRTIKRFIKSTNDNCTGNITKCGVGDGGGGGGSGSRGNSNMIDNSGSNGLDEVQKFINESSEDFAQPKVILRKDHGGGGELVTERVSSLTHSYSGGNVMSSDLLQNPNSSSRLWKATSTSSPWRQSTTSYNNDDDNDNGIGASGKLSTMPDLQYHHHSLSKLYVNPSTNPQPSNPQKLKNQGDSSYSSGQLSQQPNQPLVANNENITNTNTPAHSVHSSKSFNSTNNDLIPFRTCNSMSISEMQAEKDMLLVEKRRLQKLLKDFEHGLERMTGRRVEKADRDHMRPEYDRYKTIKCRLKLLEREIEIRSESN